MARKEIAEGKLYRAIVATHEETGGRVMRQRELEELERKRAAKESKAKK